VAASSDKSAATQQTASVAKTSVAETKPSQEPVAKKNVVETQKTTLAKADVPSTPVTEKPAATAQPTQQTKSDAKEPALASTETSASEKPVAAVSKEESKEESLLKVYRSNVMTLTYQNLVYPLSAIDRNQEGRIMISVTVNRKGKVTDIEFDEKSKHRALNKAVQKAVSAASPFPAPPKKLRGKEVTVSMPVVFSLSG
jgi:protein TonB